MSFSILGTGSALPATIITNDDLSRIVDTSDEWIRSRTGIGQRRVCTTETITDLAYQAALAALENSGCRAEELNLIICATMTADDATPSMACLLQQRLGAVCAAFDINAACTGFLYAMDIAAAYFSRQPNHKILIVGADAMSKAVDWQDRSTCVLFGDGAGAAVLGAGNDLLAIEIGASSNRSPLYAPAAAGNCRFGMMLRSRPIWLWMARKCSGCSNGYGANHRQGTAESRHCQRIIDMDIASSG